MEESHGIALGAGYLAFGTRNFMYDPGFCLARHLLSYSSSSDHISSNGEHFAGVAFNSLVLFYQSPRSF